MRPETLGAVHTHTHTHTHTILLETNRIVNKVNKIIKNRIKEKRKNYAKMWLDINSRNNSFFFAFYKTLRAFRKKLEKLKFLIMYRRLEKLGGM